MVGVEVESHQAVEDYLEVVEVDYLEVVEVALLGLNPYP
jgi:hypothetical protein